MTMCILTGTGIVLFFQVKNSTWPGTKKKAITWKNIYKQANSCHEKPCFSKHQSDACKQSGFPSCAVWSWKLDIEDLEEAECIRALVLEKSSLYLIRGGSRIWS